MNHAPRMATSHRVGLGEDSMTRASDFDDCPVWIDKHRRIFPGGCDNKAESAF